MTNNNGQQQIRLERANSLERDNNYEDNDFNDFLPMPIDGDDENDNNFGPGYNGEEILASASMVSSGGFIGD